MCHSIMSPNQFTLTKCNKAIKIYIDNMCYSDSYGDILPKINMSSILKKYIILTIQHMSALLLHLEGISISHPHSQRKSS